MTHSGPMPDAAGEFTSLGTAQRWCSKCASTTEHRAALWESSDGAYEDHKYTCTACGSVYWVDGIDS